MKRRTLLASGAIYAGLASAAIAQTRTKIVYGYTAVTDYATVFVSIEEGFFAKRGLDVEAKFIPLNPTIAPGIESGSLQMGGPTPSGFLQGVDAGLDHVVVGGGGAFSKSYTEIALAARTGSGIHTAADCVGKKIGVPGLGALLHVTFRQWLTSSGVDWKRVNFVEAPIPQHADLIRVGSVDAVVSAGPFLLRILDSGSGYVASYYTTFLPEGNPTILHVARRDWASQNPGAVKAFKDSIVEATTWMKNPANNTKLRETLGKYLKLPPPVAAKMQISPPQPVVTEKHLLWWVTMMRDQQMLKGTLDLGKLRV